MHLKALISLVLGTRSWLFPFLARGSIIRKCSARMRAQSPRSRTPERIAGDGGVAGDAGEGEGERGGSIEPVAAFDVGVAWGHMWAATRAVPHVLQHACETRMLAYRARGRRLHSHSRTRERYNGACAIVRVKRPARSRLHSNRAANRRRSFDRSIHALTAARLGAKPP
jgi:hypothetical protein